MLPSLGYIDSINSTFGNMYVHASQWYTNLDFVTIFPK